MSKLNCWQTSKERPILDFSIEFKLPLAGVFDVVKLMLNASEENHVCRIGDTEEYLGYLHDCWVSFGFAYPFYLPGYHFYSKNFREPFTLVSFFENGEVVDVELTEFCNQSGNAGYIVAEKTFGRTSFRCKNFKIGEKCEMVAPVTLRSSVIRNNGDSQESYKWTVYGSLNSDIWLDDLSFSNLPAVEIDKHDYDNSVLAKFNAKRMNGFYFELKKIAIQYGAGIYLEFSSAKKGMKSLDFH